jgi:hypothetical protein
LSALGHIDLTYGNDGRLESWTTAPPVLALRATGEADLCGWRSDVLVDLIKRFAADLGGQISEHPMDEAPQRLTVANLKLDDLELLAAEVSSELGSTISVVENPGRRIAGLLPRISSLVAHLKVAVRPGAVERFDAGTRKWMRADTTTDPGAYRSSHPPFRYFVFDGTTYRASEARLSRWLVSSPTDTRLAVDPELESLVVPLGSRLPGLWERAAVLSSGSLPEIGTSGGAPCHVYDGIQQSVRDCLVKSLLS